MRVSQTFRKDVNSDTSGLLTVSLFDIDKNIKLEDVLNEIKNIYSNHFPD